MTDDGEGRESRAYEEVFYPAERIPLVHWREVSGAQPTVLLVAAIALLSFVTGLSNLSQTTLVLDGPLASVVPGATVLARFGGVLFAFVLAVVALGLQRGKRLAWWVSLVVLPGVAVLPLTTFRPTDVPLFLLLAATYPLLVWNREEFDGTLDLSPLQIASMLAIGGVGVYGTVGSFALRDQFLELETWADAVYFVVVTIATVGYGDITPTTPEAQWFALTVILFGTGAFTVAVGSLVVPAIESRMATAFGYMTASDLSLLEDHVVVLGYGDVTASLLDRLAGEADVVVVTDDTDRASRLGNAGIEVLTGDPTDEDVLRDARVDHAQGVVASSDDDARNVLAVLAAKNVDPDVRTVAVAGEGKHVEKLVAVGADEVIDPATIGGRLLGRSVLDEEADAPGGTGDLDDANDPEEEDGSEDGPRET